MYFVRILVSALALVALPASAFMQPATPVPEKPNGSPPPPGAATDPGNKAGAPADRSKNEAKTKESEILEKWSATTSDQDYRGKRLQFPVQVIATVADAPATRNKVCIPAYTRLRGLSQLQSSGLLVRLREPEDVKEGQSPFSDCESVKSTTAGNAGLQDTFIPLREAYGRILIIPKDTSQGLPVDMNGLSYGLLFVPFKYHLTGSKSFKGSGSVGPYAGWKTESAGWASSVEFVGFLGLSSVANEQVVDGKTIKNDLSALSYGFAVIGRIRDNFQVGLVIGADRVGKDAQYADNGKAWLAVSIGYAFSR